MRLSLIAAMSENRVIGLRGRLPWRLPTDLRFFRETTWGHAVIMGRVTFDTVGRPLPGRRNIVLSRREDFAPPGIEVVQSLEEALALVGDQQEVFVAGGAQIYRLALERADRVYLTVVRAWFEGDAFFPALDPSQWRLVSSAEHPAVGPDPYPFCFQVFDRISGSAGSGH